MGGGTHKNNRYRICCISYDKTGKYCHTKIKQMLEVSPEGK